MVYAKCRASWRAVARVATESEAHRRMDGFLVVSDENRKLSVQWIDGVRVSVARRGVGRAVTLLRACLSRGCRPLPNYRKHTVAWTDSNFTLVSPGRPSRLRQI